jgi:DNA-binding beta-propeller fold protein YncE
VGRFPKPNVQGGWQWSPSGAYGCAANSSTPDVCVRVPMPGPPVACPSTDISACLRDQDSGGGFELSGRASGGRSNSLAFRPDGAVVLAFTHPDTVATYRIVELSGSPGVASLTPLRAIVGPHTGLDQPMAVAFDADGNLYVANTGLSSNAGSVTVYPPEADGDVAPIRKLAGLDHPFSLAIGP